jgi:hypothetical protein
MMVSFREASGGVVAMREGMPKVHIALPLPLLSGPLLANREGHRYTHSGHDSAGPSRSCPA